ncbi:fluoride efflux transporter FluC [Jeotgalibacillus proteolyticus]|uniref:Fluoride-specific ion channel FluC n=1 Tax=Jeotgalibacillus proteolyticus TaxID=2082395 RepID=A0A2S5GCM4_9BACL|nr:CrcB family protein [Jeotgalibacillus proteolyticus]PPA70787.1 chromosome condensation protein CrcB [Jeotgalibacillus proteolyticus]
MLVKNCIAIAAGGAAGTLCRYFLNVHTLSIWAGHPVGTVLENLLGSLLLGFLTGWVLHRKVKDWVKLGLGVGFCGGFTTMSTLAADTFFLSQESSPAGLLTYLFISLFGGLTLAFIGLVLGEKWSNGKEVSHPA